MASTKLSKHPLQIAVQGVFPLTNEYMLVADIKDNLKLTNFLVVLYRPAARIYFKGVMVYDPQKLTFYRSNPRYQGTKYTLW